MIVSIVLNDMDRTFFALYGFRSWLLQDISEPYEIIFNLFNNQAQRFHELQVGANTNACVIMKVYERPNYFNISAANNLGLHVAKGKYVLFANSDIIYPRHFLREFIGEISKKNIFYALGARINLAANWTTGLLKAGKYTLTSGFDALVGCEHRGGGKLGGYGSPWTVLRSVAERLGGFDPLVLCHEDSEFNDRVMHYLRRTGQQNCLFAVTDLFGYHMNHSGSELYDASVYSKSILEPRRLRLIADPDSDEDMIPNHLASLGALKETLYRTQPPPTSLRSSLRGIRFLRRIRSAYRAFVVES
jgi:hypothetical protein